MASRVQFKFKSAVTSETVLFDGTYISVGDLKREIVDKKGLSKDHAAELLLSEAQTGRGTHSGEGAHCGRPHLGLPPAAAAAVTRCQRRAAHSSPGVASSCPLYARQSGLTTAS
jgi:hypothetical protein